MIPELKEQTEGRINNKNRVRRWLHFDGVLWKNSRRWTQTIKDKVREQQKGFRNPSVASHLVENSSRYDYRSKDKSIASSTPPNWDVSISMRICERTVDIGRKLSKTKFEICKRAFGSRRWRCIWSRTRRDTITEVMSTIVQAAPRPISSYLYWGVYFMACLC